MGIQGGCEGPWGGQREKWDWRGYQVGLWGDMGLSWVIGLDSGGYGAVVVCGSYREGCKIIGGIRGAAEGYRAVWEL